MFKMSISDMNNIDKMRDFISRHDFPEYRFSNDEIRSDLLIQIKNQFSIKFETYAGYLKYLKLHSVDHIVSNHYFEKELAYIIDNPISGDGHNRQTFLEKLVNYILNKHSYPYDSQFRLVNIFWSLEDRSYGNRIIETWVKRAETDNCITTLKSLEHELGHSFSVYGWRKLSDLLNRCISRLISLGQIEYISKLHYGVKRIINIALLADHKNKYRTVFETLLYKFYDTEILITDVSYYLDYIESKDTHFASVVYGLLLNHDHFYQELAYHCDYIKMKKLSIAGK